MSAYPAYNPSPLPRRLRPEVEPALDLEWVLDSILPLPPLQLLVGLCEDGLPLLFDLSEVGSGALLFLADSPLANGVAMKSALAAGCRMNYPDAVNIHILSTRPRWYEALYQEPHLKMNLHAGAPEAAILVEELCNLAEQRAGTSDGFPLHIVACDELDSLLAALSPAHQEQLAWLVAQGPAAGIWVFASLTVTNASQLDPAWLKLFGTWVLGMMEQPPGWLPAGKRTAAMATRLMPGREAIVLVEGQGLPVLLAHADAEDATLLMAEARPWTRLDEVLSSFPKV